MREDSLIPFQRNILHTAVFGVDVVKGHPEDNAIVPTILSMKACILMPGASHATLRFFVEGSIVPIAGRGPQ